MPMADQESLTNTLPTIILSLPSDLFHCLADALDHIIDLIETEGWENGEIHMLLKPDFLCHRTFAKRMALAADFRQ